jgi:secondary thiamine-phosphate synthase enzyme
MVDVTTQVADAVQRLGVQYGVVMVQSPHTTAGVTINEGADPDVCSDILGFLGEAVPRRAEYRHAEGNSDAHIKTTLVGTTTLIPVAEGHVALGRWQRIFFCEFDGPRARRVFVRALV